MESPHTTGTRGWLLLIRPPNLFTVPGDPVAGFLLAISVGMSGSLIHVVMAVAASVSLYMAGLISNDCFDWREDAVDRPDRPIPSGMVSIRAAIVVAGACFVVGIGFAYMVSMQVALVALILAGLILLYNSVGKRIPIFGSINMGLCRGASLWMGAAAAGWAPVDVDRVVVAAVGLCLYIAAVTSLASRETEKVAMPVRRWMPGLAVLLCMAYIGCIDGIYNPAYLALATGAVAWPCLRAYRLGPIPEPRILMPAIGGFIRGLLLIQGAFSATLFPLGGIAAAALLLAWPASAYVARRFYAS